MISTERALFLLVTRGRVRIVHQEHRYYLRLEVYTSDIVELDTLLRQLGGSVHRQSKYTRRWMVQKEQDLLKIGILLSQLAHPAAGTLLRYTNLRGGVQRWDFCQRLTANWTGQCRVLSDF